MKLPGWPADVTRLYAYLPAYLPDRVAAKREAEHGAAPAVPAAEADVARLTAELENAGAASRLPEAATAHDALHDLVVRTRLAR
ncbi:hypothetical protein [Nonomuraea sp. NPDC049725]|uniref:hypothetical protein n=1 Tax=Nonomuraea sp. NPDC049725 TaxID=3154508 RepID=UPI0034480180